MLPVFRDSGNPYRQQTTQKWGEILVTEILL